MRPAEPASPERRTIAGAAPGGLPLCRGNERLGRPQCRRGACGRRGARSGEIRRPDAHPRSRAQGILTSAARRGWGTRQSSSPSTTSRWRSGKEKRSVWLASRDAASRPSAAWFLACTPATSGSIVLKGRKIQTLSTVGCAPCDVSCRSCFRTRMRRSIRG